MQLFYIYIFIVIYIFIYQQHCSFSFLASSFGMLHLFVRVHILWLRLVLLVLLLEIHNALPLEVGKLGVDQYSSQGHAGIICWCRR